MRRPLVALGVTVAAVLPAPATRAPVPVVVIDGRGFGHGVGMAQDGALTMGRKGASTPQILSQFYPGTRLGKAGGEVRVAVLPAAGSEALVSLPGGGEVRDSRTGPSGPGFPVRLPPGGQARIRVEGGRYSVEGVGGTRLAAVSVPPHSLKGATLASSSRRIEAAQPAPAPPPPPGIPTTTAPTTTTTAPTPTTTAPTTTIPPLITLPGGGVLPLPPAPTLVPTTTTTTPPPAPTAPSGTPGRISSQRTLWVVPAGGATVEVPARKQRYRGVVEALGSDGALRLVNHVDVEQYLRGMGEVRNPGWPAASLRAQAIAARTYALRAVGGGGELCDSQRCQVYLGAAAEYAAMDKAVSATRNQVLVFGRGLAAAVYSANGGGFSASTEEGFGTPGAGYPYLRPAVYPTGDPLTWTVRVSLRDVAGRIGYRGAISGVRATQTGTSGRVLRVTVDGAKGPKAVSGLDFDRALGLRSTFFTVRTELGAAPPPPPPAQGPVQLLPDSAGGSAAAPAEVLEATDAALASPEPAGPPVPIGPPVPEGVALAHTTGAQSPEPRLTLGALALLGVVSVLWGVAVTGPGGRDRRARRSPGAGPGFFEESGAARSS